MTQTESRCFSTIKFSVRLSWFSLIGRGSFAVGKRAGTQKTFETAQSNAFVVFNFQKSGLKPPTSVGKDFTVRRRRSKPLNPSTLVRGGSLCVLEVARNP